jgi:RNase P/RNase MRP subunit p30
MKCYDLYADEKTAQAHKRLGWEGICAVSDNSADIKRISEGEKLLGRETLAGALLSADVEKGARKALDAGADLVIVDGRTEDAARGASESWDVDLIVNPEMNEERDLIDQWNSGLDHVMSSFMAERGIGYCINAGNIRHSNGLRRVRLLGRIGQNIRLARKYGVRIVLTSGARNDLDVRNPNDLSEVGMMLGLCEKEAYDSVSKNPAYYVRKAFDRNSQDILMKGLTVKSWGSQQRKPKRKYGWY